MYKNVGKKLQKLAVVLFVLGTIGCLIMGILSIYIGEKVISNSGEYDFERTGIVGNLLVNTTSSIGSISIWKGVLTIILGPIICWVACWPIAAWGQTTENTEMLLERMGNLESEIYRIKQTIKPAETESYLLDEKDNPLNLPSL